MTHLAGNSISVASPVRAIVPTIPYRDAVAMVDWLSDAYGFERERTDKGEHGEFLHAQLAFGDSLIIVVRVEDSRFERLIVHPDRIGGVETQTCYLVVPDIDAHCARATARGAEIVSGIEADERGNRSYVSRDPEGHIWIFGTYDPSKARRRSDNDHRRGRRVGLRASLSALAFSVLMVSIATGALVYAVTLAALKTDANSAVREERNTPHDAEGDAKRLADTLRQVQAAKESAERKLSQTLAALEVAAKSEKEARSLLVQEMRTKETLARTATQSGDQLGRERSAREAAVRDAKEVTDRLSRLEVARLAAERTAREMTEKCDLERKSRALAEHSLQNAVAELARERNAKAAAELAASELRNELTVLGTVPREIPVLRHQVLAERGAREKLERAAKEAQIQLAQEKYSRDATERALKQAQDRLNKAEDRLAVASCWACPSGEPCAKP